MTTTIRPTQLDETTKPLLGALLASHNNVYLQPGFYKVPAPGKPGEVAEVILPNALLVGACKHNAGHKRVEVLGNTLGSGHFGKLFDGLGVIHPEKDFNLKVHKTDKELVVKQIDLYESDQFEVMEEEKLINQCSDKIKCKPTLFNHRYGFLRMTKGKGVVVDDFIGLIRRREIALSLLQLLKLSDGLITALHEMHQKEWVHRDIKPDNILVDLKTLEVTLIDFDAACREGPVKNLRGNWYYIAPEYVRTRIASKCADWFSMGLVLAELWGDRSIYSIRANEFNVRRAQEWHRNESFMDLFHYLDIPADIQDTLRNALKSMIRYSPASRYQYEEMHGVLTSLIKRLEDPAFDQVIANRNCIREKEVNSAFASFGF